MASKQTKFFFTRDLRRVRKTTPLTVGRSHDCPIGVFLLLAVVLRGEALGLLCADISLR